MNKQKKGIIITSILIVVVIAIVVSLYFYGLGSVSKSSGKTIPVTFVVKPGESKITIVKNLKKANLIRSEITAYIYLLSHNKLNIQAGEYIFDRSMNLKEIVDDLSSGDTNKRAQTIAITFIEGQKLTEFVDIICDAFAYNPQDVMAILDDEDFLKELIDKYWFLSDKILNDAIYYPLEGYLFPDTYEFYNDASVKHIVYRLLDNTEKKLADYKDKILNSGYDVHEIITMASIIEKEALTEEDRKGVSQVIYKRLEKGMSLGMDVTTYYAVKKSLSEPLTFEDLNTNSPYNTRNANLIGLPVGPICNVSLQSIDAALNPSKTNYLYFYADLATGKVYFAEDYQEFLQYKTQLGG
ncbi:MAG: endolytic transglycosylase MltG [Bacilli bacterium]|nr:endolytic transglycosylase MltG [Bacilli bacterium]